MKWHTFSVLLTLGCILAFGQNSQAQIGSVLDFQKISDTQGNFTGALDNDDSFGHSCAAIGDLDNDGVIDLAVGAGSDDDGGSNQGAVWILFMDPNGMVRTHQKISDTQGNFTANLDSSDQFGFSIAPLGDLNQDGTPDVAVGAHQDDDGGSSKGAVYILFLNPNGTVKTHQKISSLFGGFTGFLPSGGRFGHRVANLGDLDGDGVVDLAVGAVRDSENGADRGATWILFLNNNGTVKGQQKINDSHGNFTGVLDNGDFFGTVGGIGDLDGDDIPDLAVGAWGDDDGGTDRGAVWILFLNADGTVKAHQKISSIGGDFTGVLDNGVLFGRSVTGLEDIDGDGVPDMAVGAPRDNDLLRRGAVWILFLNPDGTVKTHQKISSLHGNFNQDTGYNDWFGNSLAAIPDLNGDSFTDLVVGALADDDGGTGDSADRGAAWVLFLKGNNAPFVDAGIDQTTTVASQMILDGTVTDDGLPVPPGTVSTLWEAISGPGTVTFKDEFTVDTFATFSADGEYVLRLTADDGLEVTFDEVTITVNPLDGSSNNPPTVDAGEDLSIILTETPAAMLDSAVTDDGLPQPPGKLTLWWQQVSGPGTITFDPNAYVVDPVVTPSVEGAYDLQLTVDDGEFAVSDTVTLIANPKANDPPDVNAGDDLTTQFLEDIPLDATVSDDGLPFVPGAVTFFWEQISGPGSAQFSPDNAVEDPTVSFSANGVYTLRLTADDGELSAFDEVTLTVGNQPPVVDAGPDREILFPNPALLNATVTDDGYPDPPGTTGLLWEKIDGPGTVTFEPDAFVEDPNLTFSEPGIYTLRLTADDSVYDANDIVTVTVHPDCNGNGKPDPNDIATGRSTDVNEDGIPDECQTDIQIVPVVTLIDPAATTEVRTTLPESFPGVVRGGAYFVEIWASDTGETNTGLTGVYVDIEFCDQTAAIELHHGSIFTTFPSGAIAAGKVDEFGGSALPSGGGVEPQWVRVGWITMNAALETSACTLSLAPGSNGVAALSRGLIDWTFVDLGAAEPEIAAPVKSYDLDDDSFIGVGDLSLFAGSWLQSVPPADPNHDFDCDDAVGVGDLSWFATGWLKSTSDPTILYPPCPEGGGGSSESAAFAEAATESFEDIAFEVVVLSAPSPSDSSTSLQASIETINNGDTYYVEVWVSDVGDVNTGVTSAYVDLNYPAAAASVMGINHGAIFTTFATGTDTGDTIDELGGSTLSGEAVTPNWARVAVIQMHADATVPSAIFSLAPSVTGVAAYSRGTIPWQDTALGGEAVPSLYVNGFVKTPLDQPVSGITVNADGADSTATDENGYYEFAVPYDWSGTIACETGGYLLVFTPENLVHDNTKANVENQIFIVRNLCDLDDNDIVNLIDFSHLLANWLANGPDLTGDIDESGGVSQDDLDLLNQNWLWRP